MHPIGMCLAGAAVLALAACDPISENGCRTGNWSQIGFDDGAKGRAASRLDAYAQTCQEFQIGVDRQAYQAGRQRGLQIYCTPENAYSVGRSGDRLNRVCSPAQQKAMSPAYQRGQNYFEIAATIDDKETRIDELRDELAAIPSNPTPAQEAERISIRQRIRSLEFDIFRLSRDLRRTASWP